MISAHRLIEQLGLTAHPEGGWYRGDMARGGHSCATRRRRCRGRASGTAIIFSCCRAGRGFANWTRSDAAELWVLAGGATARNCRACGRAMKVRFALDHSSATMLWAGQRLQGNGRAPGEWQAARTLRREPSIRVQSFVSLRGGAGPLIFGPFSHPAPPGLGTGRFESASRAAPELWRRSMLWPGNDPPDPARSVSRDHARRSSRTGGGCLWTGIAEISGAGGLVQPFFGAPSGGGRAGGCWRFMQLIMCGPPISRITFIIDMARDRRRSGPCLVSHVPPHVRVSPRNQLLPLAPYGRSSINASGARRRWCRRHTARRSDFSRFFDERAPGTTILPRRKPATPSRRGRMGQLVAAKRKAVHRSRRQLFPTGARLPCHGRGYDHAKAARTPVENSRAADVCQ